MCISLVCIVQYIMCYGACTLTVIFIYYRHFDSLFCEGLVALIFRIYFPYILSNILSALPKNRTLQLVVQY